MLVEGCGGGRGCDDLGGLDGLSSGENGGVVLEWSVGILRFSDGLVVGRS